MFVAAFVKMSAGIRAFIAGGSVFGALGVYIGSSNADKVEFYKNKLGIGASAPISAKGLDNAEDLLATAIACTKRSGEFAVLSTINKEGGVSSRLIQPFEVELENGDPLDPVIYFNTNLLSRKVNQMRSNSKVTLTYVNTKEMAYVCWEGNAIQIRDKDAAKRHWREWLRVFYPEGPDGNRFSTWVIRPQKVQVVNVSGNVVGNQVNWRAPEVVRNHATQKPYNWERAS